MTKSTPRIISPITIAMIFATVPLALLPGIYEYALLPKRLVLSAFTTLGLIHLLWRVQSKGGFDLPASILAGVFTAFVGLSLASALHAPSSDHALGESAFLIVLFSLGILATAAIRSADDWSVALSGLTIAALLTSLIGVLEYWALSPFVLPTNGPPSATFGFRNFAAMFLLCAIPLTAYQALSERSTWRSAIAAFAGSLSLVFLIYTRTRGAWLGLGVGALAGAATVFLSQPSRRSLGSLLVPRSRLAIVSGAVVIAAVLAPFGERFVDTGLQRFDEKKADVTSTLASMVDASGDRGRVAMWTHTLDLIWDHLLTGVGLGSWQHIYPAYDDGAMLRPNSTPKRPHNDYLWVTAESGVLAGLLYATIPILLLIQLYRLRREDTWSSVAPFLAAVVAGLATHAFFSFPREQPQAIVFLFVIGGAVAAAGGGRGIRLKKRGGSIVLGALILLNLGCVATTNRQIEFDRHFLAALAEEDEARWGDVESEARSAISAGLFRPHVLIILGRSLEKQGRYTEAESAYRLALEQAPYAWRAHNGLGIIYKRAGRNDEALAEYETALSIYPAARSVRNNLGALYKATGNIPRAESEYRKILLEDDRDSGANNNLANILKSRGELDSAGVHYRRALETDPDLAQAHHNLAELLVRQENYAEAIGHYLTATKLSPREALAHWGLGQAFEASGNLVGAERAYRRAIDVNPRFPRAYFSLGTHLYGLQKWEEAKAVFETFLTLWDGDQKFVRFAEGRIKACVSNQERAARAAAQAP
jgi:Flp pilus assembly protein TadD/O-antigen ligase